MRHRSTRQRFAAAALGLAMFAVTLTGCATGQVAAATGSPDPLEPSMPARMKALVHPGKELPAGHVGQLISMPWTLAAISKDRRTITVVFVAGDGWCITHAGYRLVASPGALTLAEYSATHAHSACPDKAVVGAETIDLHRSVDSIQLRHAQSDERYADIL